MYIFVCGGITAELKYMVQCGDVAKVYNLFVCSMSRDQVTESRDYIYKQLHLKVTMTTPFLAASAVRIK